MSAQRLLIFPIFLIFSTSLPVHGQSAQRAEAEKAGKEGERLLALHQAQEAAERLEKAYAGTQSARYLLPLGLAYAEAGRPLDALDALGRFLRDSPALPDARRREIGGKLQILLDQVAAVVTIEASRHNAQIKVDGRPIGMSPIEAPLRLLPGQHEIVMTPAPTDPSSGAKEIIDVRPGERRVVKLEPGPRARFLMPHSSLGPGGRRPHGAAAPGLRERLQLDFKPRELHRRWWFWTGVGAVTVLAVGLGAGLGARQGAGASAGGELVPDAPTWPGGAIDARGGALGSLAGGSP